MLGLKAKHAGGGATASAAAAETDAAEAGGNVPGGSLSHATWHVPTFPSLDFGQSSSVNVPEAAGTTESRSGNSRPSKIAKGSFNMKGLLKSVSMHSFRRPYLARHENAVYASPQASKGWLLEKQGKLHEAELMYSRHCLRSQRSHGKGSLSLASDLDRLVNLLHKEGKLEEAEPLCRRSLEIKRKFFGDDTSDVATSMVTLGRILEDKCCYDDALVLLKRGLELRQKLLEPDHPDTISALAWVGDIHYKKDEYQEALTIGRKVAAAHEMTRGPDDIKVGSSLNNIACLLATFGRSEEALALFTRAYNIYLRHLGEHHPHSVAAQIWMQQLTIGALTPAPHVQGHPPASGDEAAVGLRVGQRI